MQESDFTQNESSVEMMSIETFMRLYGVKNRTAYHKYVKLGWIETIREGKSVYITRESAQEFKRHIIASREIKE